MASLIIKANLECEKCYKKIQKVLLKLKEKENIKKLDYDNPKNTIKVTGNFKQEELAHKLRCKACEAIKDIEFVPINKPEEKKPESKKPDQEKKPEAKKEETKKSEEKKPEEKKKSDDGKKEEKKPAAGGEEKKSEKSKEEAKHAAAPAPAPSTTVNLQFTHMCGICYPWPCSDPTHWAGAGAGGVHPHWPGCKGCRIVQEGKFVYEEYPSGSACAVM
uniref:HMA domain-containing protein n=1 Tax=Leersia perrieri TaxID=77586 RepID=A0A0D9X302_9ORYZ